MISTRALSLTQDMFPFGQLVYLGTEVDVFCHRAVGEGVLEMIGVHTGAMRDHMQVM